MLEIRNCKPQDIRDLLQEDLNKDHKQIDAEVWSKMPFCCSLFVDNELMLCGGPTVYWKDRCLVWALLSKKTKDKPVQTIRGLKKYLDYLPFKRIEMTVEIGLEIGVKRAKILGFDMEVERCRQFYPGQDVHLMVLIKD